MRGLFGGELLKDQIRVEKDREVKEAIDEMEKRIYDLRMILINKENEINFLDMELGRESQPKKENIQKVNTLTAHNHSINRYLSEQKKLKV